MSSFHNYSKEFTKKALASGFSHDQVTKCLNYARPIFEAGLPIIYNPAHFSALVGYNEKYIRRAVRTDSTKWFYRSFRIKKLNGGYRTIKEPLPSLKEIQKWILNNILNNVPVSQFTKAYTSKRNIKDHVRYHKNQKVVITLDIEKFFDRITRDKIYNIFKELKYSEVVSEMLSKICTLDNKLPQGAPTSPYLSNIVMRDFDEEISKYIKAKNLKFTRYADDIAVSGNEVDLKELKRKINRELQKKKLKLNNNKTFVMPIGRRQQVSGIVVNEKIQVPREKRDELRQAMYFIDKFGLEDHLEKINCKRANYVKHLMGLANYILFINPNDERTKKILIKLRELHKS